MESIQHVKNFCLLILLNRISSHGYFLIRIRAASGSCIGGLTGLGSQAHQSFFILVTPSFVSGQCIGSSFCLCCQIGFGFGFGISFGFCFRIGFGFGVCRCFSFGSCFRCCFGLGLGCRINGWRCCGFYFFFRRCGGRCCGCGRFGGWCGGCRGSRCCFLCGWSGFGFCGNGQIGFWARAAKSIFTSARTLAIDAEDCSDPPSDRALINSLVSLMASGWRIMRRLEPASR
jgi:hypothetical protein